MKQIICTCERHSFSKLWQPDINENIILEVYGKIQLITNYLLVSKLTEENYPKVCASCNGLHALSNVLEYL